MHHSEERVPRSFQLDVHVVHRLAEDASALAGSRFAFTPREASVKLVGQLGSVRHQLDGPEGREYVLDVGVEDVDGCHMMGIAVGIVHAGDVTSVRATMLRWEDGVLMRILGTLYTVDVKSGNASMPSQGRAQELREFWDEVRRVCGRRPWYTAQFTNAPIELIGESVRFGDADEALEFGEIIALSCRTESSVSHWLRADADGRVVEVLRDIFGWYRSTKDGKVDMIFSYPNSGDSRAVAV